MSKNWVRNLAAMAALAVAGVALAAEVITGSYDIPCVSYSGSLDYDEEEAGELKYSSSYYNAKKKTLVVKGSGYVNNYSCKKQSYKNCGFAEDVCADLGYEGDASAEVYTVPAVPAKNKKACNYSVCATYTCTYKNCYPEGYEPPAYEPPAYEPPAYVPPTYGKKY